MKEYSCDYRVYNRKIYIIRGKLKNFVISVSCFEVGFYEFNLSNSSYQPYTKPNTALQYVHRESNHPPITTKNIPTGINKGLPSLSSDKASFDKAAPIHPPLRTHHDRQTQKQTAKQHSLVQPSIKQERLHQHRTQILSLIDKHFLNPFLSKRFPIDE